jgi:hypothetical protein
MQPRVHIHAVRRMIAGAGSARPPPLHDAAGAARSGVPDLQRLARQRSVVEGLQPPPRGAGRPARAVSAQGHSCTGSGGTWRWWRRTWGTRGSGLDTARVSARLADEGVQAAVGEW